MPVANAHTMLVSLNLTDIPVGYKSSLGPSVAFQLTYNHREAGQPGTFNFANVGFKWTHNFIAYIQDDAANPGQNVRRIQGGGGYTPQTGYIGGTFAREQKSRAQLTRTPATGTAASYTLSFPDGSSHTYGYTATGTGQPHRLFLTRMTDPQGRYLTLAYDSLNRLTSITDAAGLQTTLCYNSTGLNCTSGTDLKIYRVTDPFGRFAAMSYDGTNRLISITDALGITSTVAYDTTDATLITSLTTPYGTSTFAAGSDAAANTRWLETTDPLGGTDRLEFKPNASGINSAPANVPTGITAASSGYNLANSFYWDRYVKAQYGTAYANATMTHWMTDAQGKTSALAAMVKPAIDNPTYFNYPSQPQPDKEGTLGVPTVVGRKTDAATSQTKQYAYNALGNPTSITDPRTRLTTIDYDASGIDPTTTKQNTAGGLVTVGNVVTYSSHLPTKFTDAAGKDWLADYPAPDLQLASMTSPSGQKTSFVYDAYKRLLYVNNKDGNTLRGYHYPCVTSTTGDLNCNLPDWVKDFDGVGANAGYQRSFVYDKLDRITQITYPDGSTELFDYTFPSGLNTIDSWGTGTVPTAGTKSLDLWKATDRQGRVTTYTYDRNRRVNSVSETVTVLGAEVTRTTKYRYYQNGVLKELEDANGKITHWDIDAARHVTSKTYALGTTDAKTENYAYDAAGRLKTVTDALGQVKTIAYNVDNSPASYTYTKPTVTPPLPDTANVSFVYDDYFPLLKSMTDMSGLNATTGLPASATTTFDYVNPGTGCTPPTVTTNCGALQLTGETNNGYYNQHAGYFYDVDGRLVSRWAAESEETFGFDTLGRLNTYGTPLGSFSIGYLGWSGLLTSRSVTNGSVTLSQTYGYDTLNNDRRLLTITANTSAVRSYTYGYGYGSGLTDRYNIRTLVEATTAHPLGAQSWVYDYDKGDRLMSATATAVSGSGIAGGPVGYGTYSWGYDKLDNAQPINYPAVGSTPAYGDNPLYNPLNQQTKNAWWQNFSYDAAGNLTKEANEVNTTLRQYSYDMEGRLLTMTDPAVVGGYTVQFFYDGLGRRILQKTTNNGTTTYKRYLWCGQTICQQRDTGTASLRRYLATGEYVNSGTKKYVYFQDHLGSVRDLVDATTGARVGALDYTPYGKVKASQPGGILPDFQYAGLMWVGEVGLNASATRFYDGSTTRWMTRDWIRERGGINGYAYVGGNPINAIDPDGEFARIHRNGNQITIILPIRFNNASDVLKSQWKNAIETIWTRQIGDFDVSTFVVNPTEEDERTGEFNFVSAIEPDSSVYKKDTFAQCYFFNGDPRASRGLWRKNIDDKTAAHEAGHLMGLGEVPMDKNNRPIFSSDNMNLMAYDKGREVTPAQLRQIIRWESK